MKAKAAYTPDKYKFMQMSQLNQPIYPKKLHKNAFTSRILHNKNTPINNISNNPIKQNFPINQKQPSKKLQNPNLFPISFPLPLHTRPHKFSDTKNSSSPHKQHLSHRNIHRSRILSPKILPITTVTNNKNQNKKQRVFSANYKRKMKTEEKLQSNYFGGGLEITFGRNQFMEVGRFQ